MMTRTVTAYFRSVETAEQAAFGLAKQVSGVRAQVFDAGTADTGLNALSLPKGDVESLLEGVRRGGAVVYAEVPDDQFDAVADALEASGAADLDEQEAAWRQEGWTGSSATGTGQTSAAATTTAATSGAGVTGGQVEKLGAATSEARIPIVEEHIQVGKREVEHGRVRVRSYVVEIPVKEQVTLREEHVDVTRRPVDRPLTDAEDAFRERVIEATEHAEEAVVSKEARVTEELVIRKEASERAETVNGTVRRTEVEVEDNTTDRSRTTAGAVSTAGSTEDNPPGTAASRAADDALGTNISGANPTKR
ncbi:YsnF/AvaK domain-containing protein [Muricoccus pecuniae]|uniref:Stress response protein YsnF n=1 Tax=Muricoccus pecuniae TaxID=693023 RepID=A0A840YIK4_9PROT|nr:YsnF/AvaK domain-containing protein [Roseomonas pecuniae]MBB5696341.1 stress response protein YsnF [Roseomonas pecuniae]